MKSWFALSRSALNAVKRAHDILAFALDCEFSAVGFGETDIVQMPAQLALQVGLA